MNEKLELMYSTFIKMDDKTKKNFVDHLKKDKEIPDSVVEGFIFLKVLSNSEFMIKIFNEIAEQENVKSK